MLIRSLAALATVLALMSSTALANDLNSPKAVPSGERTYARFAGVKQYRPSNFYFGAHEQITGMTWSKWRKKRARGTGSYQVNDCLPSCAEGTITPTPAVVVLTGRTLCGKRFIFRRMKVFFDGRRRSLPPFCKD